MKKFLIITLLFFNTYGANLTTARIYHNYLVKITNNSSKTFRLYCSNKDWDLVLFSSASQLELFTEKFDKPLSQLQQDYNDLIVQKNARVQTLRTAQKTDAQIDQDGQMKEINNKLKTVEEKLRPVIKPKSVNSNLPCRIFGPGDSPNTQPKDLNWLKAEIKGSTTALTVTNTKNWHWPETEIRGDSITIKLTDTNEQGNCPLGGIKITAKSASYETSFCSNPSLYFGQIHLIIEENGTFKFEQLSNPIPR